MTSSSDEAPTAISVPVIADSLPRSSLDALARCSYFTITVDEPNLGILTVNNLQVPFLMLGLSGILIRPSDPQSSTFDSPDLLDDLIKLVESVEGISVETEYLWLPTALLDRACFAAAASESPSKTVAKRGDVFRVAQKLFANALAAMRQVSEFRRIRDLAHDTSGDNHPDQSIKYSPAETTAFQAWSQMHVISSQNFQRQNKP